MERILEPFVLVLVYVIRVGSSLVAAGTVVTFGAWQAGYHQLGNYANAISLAWFTGLIGVCTLVLFAAGGVFAADWVRHRR